MKEGFYTINIHIFFLSNIFDHFDVDLTIFNRKKRQKKWSAGLDTFGRRPEGLDGAGVLFGRRGLEYRLKISNGES